MNSKAGASIRTWTPGSNIGTYVLLRELARGGMGEIWLARQQGPANFERLVVLKRIIATSDDDGLFVDMFLDEARISAQLQHPNIVHVFELGQDEGSYFLAMEYLAGQPLGRVARRMVENLQQVPHHIAVEIVTAAARGLGYAHRRQGIDGKPLNIVHRDVSPQNLFVTYDGQTKVLDFGVAKAAGRRVRTATGLVRGKVLYMSPEQALGMPVTATADVFALGVVLFEFVTGTRLYGDADEVEILRRLADAQPLPSARDRAAVEPDLDKLIDKALDWNPLKRFADGSEFADALETWTHQHAPRKTASSLGNLMANLFSQEIAGLVTLQSHSDLTPTSDNARSLVDNRNVVPTDRVRTSSRMRLAVIASAAGLGVVGGALVWPRLRATHDVGAVVIEHFDAGQAHVVAPIADAGAAAASGAEEDAGVPGKRVARRGLLTLETTPWARVYLGPRLLGETPLVKVSLPAGLHRLRLVNEPDALDTYIEVEVEADHVTFKRMEF